MKHLISFILFSFVILGFQLENTWAGSISFQLTTTIQINPDLLSIQLSIKNNGNEPATEVQPTVWFNGSPHQLNEINQILPRQAISLKILNKNHSFQEKGIYYLPLHIAYRDSNGFLFKLPYVVQVVNEIKTNVGLKWSVSKVVLPTDDSVEVTLTNLDSWSKMVRLSGITAMEIELDTPSESFELKANESQTWKLNIKHDSIWPNNYTSYLIADFSNKGNHYSSYTPLPMKVISESSINPLIFSRPVMSTALVGLIIFAIIGGYGPFLYKKIWQKQS